jgi:hypothetical protein
LGAAIAWERGVWGSMAVGIIGESDAEIGTGMPGVAGRIGAMVSGARGVSRAP